ncbi:MAG: hypothetical protein GXX96_13620 [Planctomycetaceae bacterium]|jgi:hypothetical protein|nr:hypothetical protein [Planctomycetaceae bacterium]
MGFTVQVPPGTYHAIVVGKTPTAHDKYGTGIRWDFQIDKGEHAGAIVSRTTKDVASPKPPAADFWEMVYGLSSEVAIQQDTVHWIGDAGTIVVEPAPSRKGVCVTKFTLDEQDIPF